MMLPSEFDFHVFKRHGTNGRADQFTIGVWDGMLTVCSVCHIVPIRKEMICQELQGNLVVNGNMFSLVPDDGQIPDHALDA
jgi:hypothetical protein